MPPTDQDRDRDLSQLSYNEVRDFIFSPGVAQDPYWLRRRLDSLERNFEQSNFIFFVDCSPSMRNYHKQVREAFLTYVYLATKISVYGIEIGFSSQPDRRSSLATVKTAKIAFDKQDWSKPLFRQGFETFVTKTIIEKISPARYYGSDLHIFVLTDGIWGTEGTSVIQDSMHRIQSERDEYMAGPNVLMLHLMRFGNDSDGTLNLSSLVDLNITTRRNIVVDAANYDADVRQVLIGAIFHPIDVWTDDLPLIVVGNRPLPQASQVMMRSYGISRRSLEEILEGQRKLARPASKDKGVSSEGTEPPDITREAATVETMTVSTTRVHLKYPAYTLPLFVGGLLDIWGLLPSPPPTSTRSRTIRECECGIQLFEEVSQLWSNEIEDLDEPPSEAGHSVPQDSRPSSFAQNLGAILSNSQKVLSATIGITREAFKGLAPPKSNRMNPSLPLHNTNANIGGRTAQQNAQPDTWLLLCIDKGSRRTFFRQELFLDIANDQALFDFLRDKYFAHRQFRSWFTLRQMQTLALAQVRLDLVDFPSEALS